MHDRWALKIVAGLAILPLCASVGLTSEHHWTYEGEAGRDKWGGLDPADAPCAVGVAGVFIAS
jgi:carbonic anhydrase